MRLEIDIPEHQYNNIMSIDSISLGRAPYKGIIMYAINAIKQGKVLEQEPTTKNNLGVEYISRSELMAILSDYYDTTVEYRSMLKEIAALPVVIQESTTKNDLPHCQYSDEEIAKSFIEDVGAVKDQLPCGEQMDFPNTFDEFAKDYGFKDKNEVYTNGIELIPVYRVKQWLEHISTTKKDLGVDCISRKQALDVIRNLYPSMPRVDFNGNRRKWVDKYKPYIECEDAIKELPTVTPQPRKGHWILTDVESYRVWHCHCSECGKDPQDYIGGSEDWWLIKGNLPKFCPNCGSRNEVEE